MAITRAVILPYLKFRLCKCFRMKNWKNAAKSPIANRGKFTVRNTKAQSSLIFLLTGYDNFKVIKSNLEIWLICLDGSFWERSSWFFNIHLCCRRYDTSIIMAFSEFLGTYTALWIFFWMDTSSKSENGHEDHRWTRSKILEGGVVSFPEGGGCKFFESEGGYPPLTPPEISPTAVTIFDSTFFH